MSGLVYGSVCSGIEAASVAWHQMGWTPSFFSEIDPFPRAVLAHHFPEVPLHGDFTSIQTGDYRPIDLLVGGTPCQSFSVAGLRGGLADERGNLALEYLRLADRLRPQWLVWENVPGVLSSSGGRDFSAFLGGLVELGYGFAYRVLDAQFFGVAQRRRRVFVVGYLGDWRPAAAVLFEPHSLSGHPPPRRAPRQGTAADAAPSLTASGGGVERTGESRGQDSVVAEPAQVASTLTFDFQASGEYGQSPVAATLNARDYKGAKDLAVDVFHSVTRTKRGRDGESSLEWRQGGDIIQTVEPVPYDLFQITAPINRQKRSPGDPNHTLAKDNAAHAAVVTAMKVSGFDSYNLQDNGDLSKTLNTGQDYHHVPNVYAPAMQVRRLTPTECERLQGFPDGYTAIPYRNKPAADGPRYKALGNSMAVPVMRWIGQRINAVDRVFTPRGKQ